jgi:hypothetical protein
MSSNVDAVEGITPFVFWGWSIFLGILDLVSSMRHPFDQIARQRTRLRLQRNLAQSICRLRRPS